eukprot:RCo021454
MQLSLHPQSSAEILCEHRGSQAVRRVVGPGNHLLLRLELKRAGDRSKDFLLGARVVIRHVGEQGRADEVALGAHPLPAALHLRALLLALFDVPQDLLELDLVHLGALVGVRSKLVTQLDGLRPGDKALHKLVVHSLLDEDSGPSTAHLAVVEEDSNSRPSHGYIEISVVEDNVGRLAPELQSHSLEVRLRRELHDGSAGRPRTGEGNLQHILVGRQRGPDGGTEPRDQVEDSVRKPNLVTELRKQQCGERGLLRGLQHQGVTAGQAGGDLPGKHQEGKIPRDDRPADPNGLPASEGEVAGVRLVGHPLEISRQLSVELEGVDRQRNIHRGGVLHRLPVVQGLNVGELLGVLANPVGELPHPIRTGIGGQGAPSHVGSLGRGHRGVYVLGPTLGDLAHLAPSGGIDDVHLLLLCRLHKLSVNEQAPVEGNCLGASLNGDLGHCLG